MPSLQIKNHRIERKICNRFCFTVFEAVSEPDSQKRFLKILDPALARDETCVFKYLNGARMASRIQSDHVCKIFRFGRDGQRYVIASEHVDAKTLAMCIRDDFPMPVKRVLDLVMRLANILREMHLQGVVHGLLNPGSIFVAEEDALKIDDPGYQWVVPHLFEHEDKEGMYLTYYMAPEVYFGHEHIDGRADIYSLGTIFLQLLANENFNGQLNTSLKHNQLLGAIPQIRNQFWHHAGTIEPILGKCLGINPDFRYQNLKDLLTDLQTLEHEITAAESGDSQTGRE